METLEQLNTRHMVLEYMDKAVWQIKHNKPVAEPSDELAENIVDFIMTNTDNEIAREYLEMVVQYK